MLKELVKVANRLDHLGLQKEADLLDQIIKKMAWPWDGEPMKITRDIDFGNEKGGIRYIASTKNPYEYQTFYTDKSGPHAKIYCAPDHKSNSLCIELSLEAWNKNVESLMSGKSPSSL